MRNYICNCGNKKSYKAKQCCHCYYKSLSGKGNPMYGTKRNDIIEKWKYYIHKRKTYKCADCGAKISDNRAKRCKQCNHIFINKHKLRNGQLNPNYKHGRKVRKHYKCLDCGKPVTHGCKLGHCKSRTSSGKKNGMWKGGSSFIYYPSEFSFRLKEQIRKRDNYRCQRCGIKECNLIGYKKKLTVHHIDYNKQNCKKENLITICEKCNSTVESNRDFWFAYFTYILEHL